MTVAIAPIDQIFWQAAQLAGKARDAYLADACGGDAELRQRVEQLLHVQPKISAFLEQPFESPVAACDAPGNIIGPYKLLEQIGEGGMGLVFMAEQTVPLRRLVALKVLKPGMDTREVVARFEVERQALALMDHPNIARIFDAGTTGSPGRPYFVMELVKGVPISEFCDQHRLTTRQRLALFVTVCLAVQHAHQKGIIHRDLKPGNVLVTLHDTVAVPKVIDFGIAKATGQRLTEQTLFTHFAQVLGSPLYMSPEQAQMNGLDVDTRSDIYSLGVMLYELLTGTTPFVKETMKEAGLDEMRRLIREEEPPRPSHRVSTLGVEACSTVHAQRGVDDRRLSDLLRGELDWIVMKSLEKDRNRRYESASALAADVQRYLNDEAVEACPPSRSYRVRKLARRNLRTLVPAFVIALALVTATAVSIWQAAEAREAQRQAEADRTQAENDRKQAEADRRKAEFAERKVVTEAAIATAVSNFLQDDLLRLVEPQFQVDEGFRANPNLTVRETLDRAAARIDGRFQDQPLVEAKIRMTIGNAYISVGEPVIAVAHLEKAIALRKAHLGPGHLETVWAVHSLAMALENSGKLDKAASLLTEWRESFEAAFGTNGREATLHLHACVRVCYKAGKLDDAEDMERTCLAISRKLDPPTLRTNTMYSLAWISRINLKQKKYVPAEAAAREALMILEQDAVDHPWARYILMSSLGGALLGQEKYSAAEPLLLKGYEGLRGHDTTLGSLPENWRLAEAIERIVWFYEATNQSEKARAWREKLDPPKRADRDR